MQIEIVTKRGLRWWGFWRRKMGYLGRAAALILLMSRHELAARWARGEAEHGKMTDEQFKSFPSLQNLKEELQDGYWYNHIYNEQKRKP